MKCRLKFPECESTLRPGMNDNRKTRERGRRENEDKRGEVVFIRGGRGGLTALHQSVKDVTENRLGLE